MNLDKNRVLRWTPKTGETVTSMRAVKFWRASPFERIALLDKKEVMQIREIPSDRIRGTIKPATFARLAACFAPTRVFISESGGPLRAFDVSTTDLLWTVTPA